MKLALVQFPDTKHTLHMFYIYTDHLFHVLYLHTTTYISLTLKCTLYKVPPRDP